MYRLMRKENNKVKSFKGKAGRSTGGPPPPSPPSSPLPQQQQKKKKDELIKFNGRH